MQNYSMGNAAFRKCDEKYWDLVAIVLMIPGYTGIVRWGKLTEVGLFALGMQKSGLLI